MISRKSTLFPFKESVFPKNSPGIRFNNNKTKEDTQKVFQTKEETQPISKHGIAFFLEILQAIEFNKTKKEKQTISKQGIRLFFEKLQETRLKKKQNSKKKAFFNFEIRNF